MTVEEKQAKALLDRLIALDYQTVEAYYEMGSLVSAIQHGNLYELIGYSSIKHLVEEELTFTPTTAYKYAKMYRRFRQLKYTKLEAINLLRKFGLTPVSVVLRQLKDKVGERAFKKRVESIDMHILNFQLTSAEMEIAHQILQQFGARQSGERWIDSSHAFMSMIEVLRETKKAA
jgi:hypothetical protein